MKPIMCHVGSTDKKIRITLGLIVLITLFIMQSWLWLGGVVILVIASWILVRYTLFLVLAPVKTLKSGGNN